MFSIFSSFSSFLFSIYFRRVWVKRKHIGNVKGARSRSVSFSSDEQKPLPPPTSLATVASKVGKMFRRIEEVGGGGGYGLDGKRITREKEKSALLPKMLLPSVKTSIIQFLPIGH